MGNKRRGATIGELLAAGDRAGAKALVDANLTRDPASLHRRWEQAAVYCRVGLVEPGLSAALALRETEAWPEIAKDVWDLTLWAGRPDIGVSLVEEWLDVIEDRADINAVPCTWQHIARVYLGLSWAAGRASQAEARLAGHANLRDSGWRMEKNKDIIVWNSADSMVDNFLPPTVAAVQGRFVSCGEYTEDYDALLAALFSLSELSPQQAWARLDQLETERSLHPIGAAYRAQTARRGGDPASAHQWLYAWFADPNFPMDVSDLVVTGLLRFFVEVRGQWLASVTG
ncbi:Uncharacterised protein [Mycolicibacterium vanbaalenii]|uniref:Uncharacterized protein n=1 Tax=Mycolicibacterium vanbaalenii TaxID=110539 RepID=A0A5S9PWD5_MYCVN|nr:hypothetical protein [Mycolicibacterium vanbaalenii]CAA0109195.1 Uncharacterised protein [Mycolicibacterium vanbaalenii]